MRPPVVKNSTAIPYLARMAYGRFLGRDPVCALNLGGEHGFAGRISHHLSFRLPLPSFVSLRAQQSLRDHRFRPDSPL